MCHGYLSTEKGESQFIFESDEQPYLADCFSESRLLQILKKRQRCEIDVIVLSSCHSSQLGEILLRELDPAPAIIAINS